MAKKIKIAVSVVVLIFLLLAVGVIPTGKVNTHSNYYSDREINSAIFMAKLYFTLNFKGCDLIDIKTPKGQDLESFWAGEHMEIQGQVLREGMQALHPAHILCRVYLF